MVPTPTVQHNEAFSFKNSRSIQGLHNLPILHYKNSHSSAFGKHFGDLCRLSIYFHQRFGCL